MAFLTGIGAWLVLSAGSSFAAANEKAAEPPPDYGLICITADSGLVLHEYRADEPGAPASMVKMLLMLLVSEGVREGRWTLETEIQVTSHAQHMGGTQVYLEVGEKWPLGRLMLALAVASANDAAMAVAEGLWGSEAAYMARMNQRAQELGMAHSKFASVHGLPPDKGVDPDVTTARDMATLAQHCVREPLVMEWVSQKEFQFRPENEVKFSTNKLLWQMNDCDGIKTGYTRQAGFCVTATAQRNGVRLISVVLGCGEKHDRFALARQMLEDGFGQVRRVQYLTKGQAVSPAIPIDNCETEQISLCAGQDLWVVAKEADVPKLKATAQQPQRLQAPLQAGAELGAVRVELAGATLASSPLVLPQDLAAAGWRFKLKHSLLNGLNSVLGRSGKS